jgi:hypothetical protein
MRFKVGDTVIYTDMTPNRKFQRLYGTVLEVLPYKYKIEIEVPFVLSLKVDELGRRYSYGKDEYLELYYLQSVI